MVHMSAELFILVSLPHSRVRGGSDLWAAARNIEPESLWHLVGMVWRVQKLKKNIEPNMEEKKSNWQIAQSHWSNRKLKLRRVNLCLPDLSPPLVLSLGLRSSWQHLIGLNPQVFFLSLIPLREALPLMACFHSNHGEIRGRWSTQEQFLINRDLLWLCVFSRVRNVNTP